MSKVAPRKSPLFANLTTLGLVAYRWARTVARREAHIGSIGGGKSSGLNSILQKSSEATQALFDRYELNATRPCTIYHHKRQEHDMYRQTRQDAWRCRGLETKRNAERDVLTGILDRFLSRERPEQQQAVYAVGSHRWIELEGETASHCRFERQNEELKRGPARGGPRGRLCY